MKRCPFCAEEIQDAAIVCRFCQRDLPAPPRSAARPDLPAGLEGIALADPVNPPDEADATLAPAAPPAKSVVGRLGTWLLLAMLVGCGACGYFLFGDSGRVRGQLADRFDNEFSNTRSGVRPYTSMSLQRIDNPKGDGEIVFLTWSTNHVWVLINDQIYCLNGRAKGATPNVPFLREAPQHIQEQTGLTVSSISDILVETAKYER